MDHTTATTIYKAIIQFKKPDGIDVEIRIKAYNEIDAKNVVLSLLNPKLHSCIAIDVIGEIKE